MKLQKGSIVLLIIIFIVIVAGSITVNMLYAKKHVKNKTIFETVNSKKHGEISYERYYSNGKNTRALGFYKDGSLKSEYYLMDNTGTSFKFISYYPNKKMETRSLNWVENGERQYLYEEYFEDGRIRKREGSQLLKWEYYDENGEPTVIYLRGGNRTTETSYYPGWKRQEESEYLNNKRDGHWIQWDTTGNVTKNEEYKDGIRVVEENNAEKPNFK